MDPSLMCVGIDESWMGYFKQGSHDGLCGLYATLNGILALQEASTIQFLGYNNHAFFDEAVECLARVPGIDIRILKSCPVVGGIDQFQIRDLCTLLAERMNIPMEIAVIGPDQRMPFARRYRALHAGNQPFAIIAAYRDGSHWTVVARHERNAYRSIDGGRSAEIYFKTGESRKLANDAAVVLTLPKPRAE